MPLNYQLFYQHHLPHYQPSGATLFITFRLAGSLPVEVIRRLEAETRQKDVAIETITDPNLRQQEAYLAQKQFFGQWDKELDQNKQGPHWLTEPSIAQLVKDAIRYRDGKAYTLEAACIMPNHVHLVCTPLSPEGQVLSLAKIMQSLKGYTARQANLLLRRSGDFWQHESYDHVVHDADELKRVVEYVLNNPRKAGLATQWAYCRTSC